MSCNAEGQPKEPSSKKILSLDFSFLTLLTPLRGDCELGRSFVLNFYKESASVLCIKTKKVRIRLM